MCEYCQNEGALSLAKEALRRIEKLEYNLNLLDMKFNSISADKELELMKKLKDKYVPAFRNNKVCDYTEIGDQLYCTNCHKGFYTEVEVPPYCPYCFAKYIGEEKEEV